MNSLKILFLTLVISIISPIANGQNWWAGGSIGTIAENPVKDSDFYFNLGTRVKFKPEKGYFAINAEPGILLTPRSTLFHSNLYLAFEFGKKFKISPGLGANYLHDFGFGGVGNLEFAYAFERFFVFAKAEYRMNGYTRLRYNKSGDLVETKEQFFTSFFNVGALIPLGKEKN